MDELQNSKMPFLEVVSDFAQILVPDRAGDFQRCRGYGKGPIIRNAKKLVCLLRMIAAKQNLRDLYGILVICWPPRSAVAPVDSYCMWSLLHDVPDARQDVGVCGISKLSGGDGGTIMGGDSFIA